MAIISNFELLYKPIAPIVGPAAEIGRVAVQGYFLEISNLENRDIALILRTRTPVKDDDNGDAANTEFTASNNVVVFDITADNVFETTMTDAGEQIAGKQRGHYVSCINIPAGQTGSLAILPNAQNLFASPVADLAIRGYAELLLSSNIDSLNPLTFSAPESARILVSAEHRGTFVDPEFNPGDPSVQTDLDFDQLAYSLNTANGKGIQIVNTHAPCNDPFQDLLTSNALLLGDSIEKIGASMATKMTNPQTKISSLRSISKHLYKKANGPAREFVFKLGIVPIKITYLVKKGKYQLEEKSTSKAIGLLLKRKKLSKKEFIPIDLVSLFNKALAGNKKADQEAVRILEKLI